MQWLLKAVSGPKFMGEEQPDGETFVDWLEKFESVAIPGGME